MKKFLISKKIFFFFGSYLLVALGGIFIVAFFSSDTNHILQEKIISLYSSYQSGSISSFSSFGSSIFQNAILSLILWVLGVSVFGGFLLYPFSLIQTFSCFVELTSLFLHFSSISFLFFFLYSFLLLFNLFLLVFLCYMGCHYSYFIFQLLFLKRSFSVSRITKKYFQLFLFVLLGNIISSVLEVYLIPFILTFFS